MSSLKKKESSGLYLLSEIQCLSPGTGAYHHIQNGLLELNKHFGIELFIISKRKTPATTTSKTNFSYRKTSGPVKNIIKWIYFLIVRNYDVLYWYIKIRRKRPLFIYERAASLNFKGLVISKLLRIPHFYEVNGVFFLENSKNYPAVLNRLAKKIESNAYSFSTFSFFVGGISDYLGMRGNNFANVQNGIETTFLRLVQEKRFVYLPENEINVVFIGHAMSHHRLDILVDACSMLKDPSRFRFHFIGGNYEKFNLTFAPSIKVSFHGDLSHESIAALISNFEIGILPYAVPFSSAVKLFMYGAAKLLLLIPDAKNLKEIFSQQEAVFFENENVADLAKALEMIALDHEHFQYKRDKGYSKVKSHFLWEKIFCKQAELMRNYIYQ